MWFKVANLQIFKENRLGGFNPGLLCIIVRERQAFGHGPPSPVYIISREGCYHEQRSFFPVGVDSFSLLSVTAH